jgi:DnaJ-class molecular chaperone
MASRDDDKAQHGHTQQGEPKSRAAAATNRQGQGSAGANPGDQALLGTPGAGENVCRRCAGSGRIAGGTECPDCGGTGVVIEEIGGA